MLCRRRGGRRRLRRLLRGMRRLQSRSRHVRGDGATLFCLRVNRVRMTNRRWRPWAGAEARCGGTRFRRAEALRFLRLALCAIGISALSLADVLETEIWWGNLAAEKVCFDVE